ncbi:hypothetical protein PPTG_05376 [Phytophthora nicotianae INRA-310]|uniref:Uncharacterized protein n=1 Tax=Phytophthora nicotianae (strain INRA-310) TaxID=761204 RepID=W2QZC0_PHYN3|nr:hypothetical protein PPTG_05376 [Phytophthora nicotianae INRA-310]ETN17620.1 hypothetical protein PPTG_05376 [Phytophthora nicotianae INRA-310]
MRLDLGCVVATALLTSKSSAEVNVVAISEALPGVNSDPLLVNQEYTKDISLQHVTDERFGLLRGTATVHTRSPSNDKTVYFTTRKAEADEYGAQVVDVVVPWESRSFQPDNAKDEAIHEDEYMSDRDNVDVDSSMEDSFDNADDIFDADFNSDSTLSDTDLSDEGEEEEMTTTVVDDVFVRWDQDDCNPCEVPTLAPTLAPLYPREDDNYEDHLPTVTDDYEPWEEIKYTDVPTEIPPLTPTYPPRKGDYEEHLPTVYDEYASWDELKDNVYSYTNEPTDKPTHSPPDSQAPEDTTVPPHDTGAPEDTTVPPEDTSAPPAESTAPVDTTAPPKDSTAPENTTAPPKDTAVPEDTTAPPKDTPEDTTAPPKDTPEDTTAPPKDSTAPENTTAPPKDTVTPEDTTAPPKDSTAPDDTTAPPADSTVPEDTAAPPKESTAPPADTTTPVDTTAPPIEDTPKPYEPTPAPTKGDEPTPAPTGPHDENAVCPTGQQSIGVAGWDHDGCVTSGNVCVANTHGDCPHGAHCAWLDTGVYGCKDGGGCSSNEQTIGVVGWEHDGCIVSNNVCVDQVSDGDCPGGAYCALLDTGVYGCVASSKKSGTTPDGSTRSRTIYTNTGKTASGTATKGTTTTGGTSSTETTDTGSIAYANTGSGTDVNPSNALSAGAIVGIVVACAVFVAVVVGAVLFRQKALVRRHEANLFADLSDTGGGDYMAM